MHLHFSKLRYGALRRMKKIVYIHSAFDLIARSVTAILLPEVEYRRQSRGLLRLAR
jgi:hypothetical protein